MSKTLNFLKGINIKDIFEQTPPYIVFFAVPMLIFHPYKTTTDYMVLVAYLLAVGFAFIQWDRNKFRKSHSYLLAMAVWLVFGWANSGIMWLMIFNSFMFIVYLYYWSFYLYNEVKRYFVSEA